MSGGVACMVAAAATHPIDTLKLRLQLQNELTHEGRYRGLLAGLTTLVRDEGLRAVYRGLSASLLREATYSSLRMGLYPHCKTMLSSIQLKYTSKNSNNTYNNNTSMSNTTNNNSANSNNSNNNSSGNSNNTNNNSGNGNNGTNGNNESGNSNNGTNGNNGSGNSNNNSGNSNNTNNNNSANGNNITSNGNNRSANSNNGSSNSNNGNNNSLLVKVAAGAVSGGVGSAISTPTDLIKIRMQADTRSRQSMFAIFTNIVRTQGFTGLYRGVAPNTARAMILTSSQLSSYDHTKCALLDSGLEDGTTVHCIAAMVSGVICSTAAAPVDLVKSRFMNQEFSHLGVGLKYSNTWDCLKKVVRTEGVSGLYKGWMAAWLRLGPHTMITFIGKCTLITVMEQLQRISKFGVHK